MDQLVSQLLPSQRIGADGFNWWVGQVEGTARDEANNKGGYRFKVRIVGEHPGDAEVLATEDLPWATVVMPVTVPFMPGNTGGAHPQLEVGCWVVGFYLDLDRQKPIIMGSIGQVPGATKTFVERTPDTKPFVTAIRQLNAQADGSPKQKGTEKNTSTGGLYDGTKDGEGNDRVAPPARKVAPLKKGTAQAEDWCQSKAEKCDDDDMMGKMSTIMSEFMEAVQNNGGDIGTYLVNEASGQINNVVGIARNYVNKAMSVVTEFVAKVKGFIIEKLKAAVNDLIQALLYPSEEGNALTPVTEFFNELLKNLGCQMADLGDRLAGFLTDVLMSYVDQIYQAAACQIDALVNGIISKINSLMESILGSVLGPLQSILGAIASPLNILGGAINFVLNLLGISCSGPDRSCSKYKKACTDGGEDEEGENPDFLDDLLAGIDNLFPATGADYTQYVCDDAYTGNSIAVTKIGFKGGVPQGGGTTGNIPPSSGTEDDGLGGDDDGGGDGDDQFNGDPVPKVKRIKYHINDVTVREGDRATFLVTRSGYTEGSSSVKYRTKKYSGTATPDEDYLGVNDILGFAPGETEKRIQVTTLFSEEREQDEDFYVVLRPNTPNSDSNIKTSFIKNIGVGTITEYKVNEPYNPYRIRPQNPFYEIPERFSGETPDLIPAGDQDPDTDGDGFNDNTGEPVDDLTPRISVSPDRSTCPEGEFIVYTIETANIDNGSIFYYTLSGTNITREDIIGNNLTGDFTINNGIGKVTVGIEDDDVVEDEEILRFTINGTGAFADVLITTTAVDGDDDLGEGDDPNKPVRDFEPPTVDPINVITDPNGGIIDIPITNPGDPWAEPPYVTIGGAGISATATALLDEKGFLTEIRVKTPGYGYKLNLPATQNKRCIIDSFTLIRPGIDYTEPPTIYVDGRTDVAEALIDDQGFVIGARVLDRVTTYEKMPEVLIVGGNGFGAKLIPSLACLDTEALTTIGSTKIGTGRYVDCP